MEKRTIRVKFNDKRDAHEEATYNGVVAQAKERGVSERDARTTLDIAGFWKQYNRGAGRKPGQPKNELLEEVYEKVLVEGVSSNHVVDRVFEEMHKRGKPWGRNTVRQYIDNLRTLPPQAALEKSVAH